MYDPIEALISGIFDLSSCELTSEAIKSNKTGSSNFIIV
jgi:hypothetical protein